MMIVKEKRSFLRSISLLAMGCHDRSAAVSANSQCSAVTCFDKDFFAFGYAEFFEKYLNRCQAAKKEKVIPEANIPLQFREFFQSNATYKAVNISNRKLGAKTESYNLFQLEGELGGLIPFRGLVSKPKNLRGYCVLLHGMASSPERCFSLETDYMGGVARKLTDAGFAVWCPFIPQGGNFPSMVQAAVLLAGNGLSHHTMLCSLATCYQSIFRSVGLTSKELDNSTCSIYGVSIGASIALHTSLIDRNIKAIVCSGYLRNDNILKNDATYLDNLRAGAFYPDSMNPVFRDYEMPAIFKKIPKIPLFFEIGESDTYSSTKFGRDQAFRAAKQAFGAKENLVKLLVHAGGHEVDGDAAINWISGIGSKY